MGEVRRVLGLLDGELLDDGSHGPGMPVKQACRETGHTCQTIRRWRDNPRYREATLEYDPAFNYDHTDLLDRAVVARHLCTETEDIGERLDLLMAAVGSTDVDNFSIPTKKQTRRKGL